MSRQDLNELEYEWFAWARHDQIPPVGDWINWLTLSGRGWGKTRVGAEWVRMNVTGPTPLTGGLYGRLALIAETAADGRDVMVEGQSGIMNVCPKGYRPKYEPTKRRLTWPNGAMATLYNAVEPDQLRGPQHEAAWCDEIAKWRYIQQTWDMLQFGLRLGPYPRCVITTTPRPIPLIKYLMNDPKTVVTRGHTYDNAANLAPSFLETLRKRYAGTRLGRQEIEAQVLEDVPGALWTRADIEECRVTKKPSEFKRIVIGVDPSGTKGQDVIELERGDDIGIIVAGLAPDDRVYVLEDLTCNENPLEWARRVVKAYKTWLADAIVVEKNYGGAMVAALFQTVEPMLPIVEVVASRGKYLRAEPISSAYSQKVVKHVGAFPELEDEMIAMCPNGYQGGGSPNRLDAMVWAVTNLIGANQGYIIVEHFPL